MSTSFTGFQLSQGIAYPAKPSKVVKQFFVQYHLPDVQHYLNALLLCALTTNNSEHFANGVQRGNVMFFIEQIWYMAQAAHALQEQQLSAPIIHR